MSRSCLGKMPRCNRLGCISLLATMHEAGEKSPLEKGSELSGFSLEPMSASKMEFPQELPPKSC